MVWKNWAETVTATPRNYVKAQSVEEICQIVKSAAAEKRKIRMVASGHSFTKLCASDDIMMDISALLGIVEMDKPNRQITFWAGTTVRKVGVLCLESGLAQENLGDFDLQTLAGAISTGTHGTGVDLTGIANQIVAFWVVTATGEIMECSKNQNPDIFEGGRVGLGVLGVIVKVKLQLEDAYKLKAESSVVNLLEILPQVPQLLKENRNLEFFFFPMTDKALMKRMCKTDEAVRDPKWKNYLNQKIIENIGLKAVCEATSKFNIDARRINKIMAFLVGSDMRINHYNRILATDRLVKFNEMEFSIPAQFFEEFLLKLNALFDTNYYHVFFPIEIRWVKSDDIWLSPAYQRESVYFAVHTFKKSPVPKYFEDVQNLAIQYGGRPHWGKSHSLDAEYFSKVYPRWEDFKKLRAILDPDGLFLSPYMKTLFGV